MSHRQPVVQLDSDPSQKPLHFPSWLISIGLVYADNLLLPWWSPLNQGKKHANFLTKFLKMTKYENNIYIKSLYVYMCMKESKGEKYQQNLENYFGTFCYMQYSLFSTKASKYCD